MLIQVHILQNYAPSNLNRDDNNRPKSAWFGGVERGRVSSQSLKRAIRFAPLWRNAFDGLLAERTNQLPTIMREELASITDDTNAIDAIVARVREIGKKDAKDEEPSENAAKTDDTTPQADQTTEAPKSARSGKGKKKPAEDEDAGDGETGQLILIAPNERRRLAEKLFALYQQAGPDGWKSVKINEKVDAKELGIKPYSPDVALFGRMTTSTAFVDIPAAAQIAHAISTNEMQVEADYFTGLDDRTNIARIIGDTEFNSGTYYKFVNVFWDGLVNNLAQGEKANASEIEVARRAVLKLTEGIINVHPTGKLNPFANYQSPDFVLVEVREQNLPLSYANSFLKPVRYSEEMGLMEKSATQLADYIRRMDEMYGFSDKRAYATSLDGCIVPRAEHQTHKEEDGKFTSAIDNLLAWLDKQLPWE